MKVCKHDWEYAYTVDRALPYGDIESTAIFRCKICGEIIDECDYLRRTKQNNRIRSGMY